MADLARQLNGIRATRRTAIRASLGAAGAAAGWQGRAAAARQATPEAAAELPGSAWTDLAGTLSGQLLRPEDAAYPAAARINAARYATTMPGGIAMCASAMDVQACVNWARETGAPFAVKTGGHNYAGFCTSSGLVIDTTPMGEVAVDEKNGTTTVQGGAIVALMLDQTKLSGRYFPMSRCPSVGMAGLTMGGGWSFSSRLLGATCDSLVATDLVTADGELVRASESENPDLFWALRGGTGGNFGVNVSLTYRTVRAQQVTVVKVRWSGGKTGELLEAILKAQLSAPREFGIRVAVLPSTNQPATDPGPLEIDVVGMHWGPISEVKEIMAPVEALQAPVSRDYASESLANALVALYGAGPGGMFEVKTGFVTGAMEQKGIAEALDWIGRMPGVPDLAQDGPMVFYCFGQAVSDVAPDATAFVHRTSDFIWLCETLWLAGDDPGLVDENLAWIEGFHGAMQPYLSGGAYQNFPDRSQRDWATAYFGDNLPRLSEVKRTWDPGNLFRFGQSIPLDA